MTERSAVTRRTALALGAVTVVMAGPGRAQSVRRDARATDEAIRAFTGGGTPTPGRVTIDIPPLVENGNSAPLKLNVEGLFREGEFVRRIAVFNERNPLPNVVTFDIGPRTSPKVSTRIRLADSQTITAIAEFSDGAFHSATADVIVTLAACVEG